MTATLTITQATDHSPPVIQVAYECTFTGCEARFILPYNVASARGVLEDAAARAGWTWTPIAQSPIVLAYQHPAGLRPRVEPRCPLHPYGTPVGAIEAPRPATRKRAARKPAARKSTTPRRKRGAAS